MEKTEILSWYIKVLYKNDVYKISSELESGPLSYINPYHICHINL